MVVLANPEVKNRHHDALRANRSQERQYLFDAAFGPDSTQQEVCMKICTLLDFYSGTNPNVLQNFFQVYERTCAQLVRAVLDGYNACCFAYGATGGGKTHTMVGTHEDPGCMVKALNELFREMDENHDFTFRVSS